MTTDQLTLDARAAAVTARFRALERARGSLPSRISHVEVQTAPPGVWVIACINGRDRTAMAATLEAAAERLFADWGRP